MADRRLQEIYTGMGRILRCPRDYGLGENAPQPLVDRLETWLGLLGEVMREREKIPGSSNGDLEVELSQDADSPCPTGSR